ncbi:hypothetical protein ME796_11500 [Lactobacillus delbrueckii]|nr:hypothetical protein ME783_11430 [Lactobacillus delbrueckii]GHN41801.1 hypothetical protein ME796_11500 [Lactobacillus delbrueckii]
MDDLACPDRQHELKEISSFCARKELLYIPAQVKRIDHIQHSYKCQNCSDKAPADKIINAPVSKAPLTNSLGSASLISNTIYANFPGFYNSSHTADRFSASRISFMHDFPEMRGSQL